MILHVVVKFTSPHIFLPDTSIVRNQDKMLLLSFAFVAECNAILQSKQVVLYSAILLPMIMAVEENKIKSSSDHLKNEFGCLPLEKWTVIQSGNGNVEIICMSTDYNAEIKPKGIYLNPMLLIMENYTVVNIDEKKEAMTLDIQWACSWVDERIIAVFSKRVAITQLPQGMTEERTSI